MQHCTLLLHIDISIYIYENIKIYICLLIYNATQITSRKSRIPKNFEPSVSAVYCARLVEQPQLQINKQTTMPKIATKIDLKQKRATNNE